MAEMQIKFPLDTNRPYSNTLDIQVIDKVDADGYGQQLTPVAARALARVLLTVADTVESLAQVEHSIKRKNRQEAEEVALEPAGLPAPEVPALPAD